MRPTNTASAHSNRPSEGSGWGMRPRLDVATLKQIHTEQGCNDFGAGGTCSVCRPECTCKPSERIGKPFGWHKAECACPSVILPPRKAAQAA